jgi:glycosyltransferase involved in cell wall biosynthesis
LARPLRFCHLTTFYPPYSFGGDAMFIHRLVNALAARGHEVDVVHCADSYLSLAGRAPQSEAANHPNVTVHTLQSRWGILSPLLTQQTGQTSLKSNRLRQILLSKKFDVIHYHNISLLGPEVLTLQPDYADFLKVYTAHEHWLVCPMHILWKNNARLCDRPDCFRCTLHFRRPPQWWRYTRLLERCAAAVDVFLSPSRFTVAMHRERGFSRPLKHIPYFVPSAELGATPAEASPHSRPYFLFVGRLEVMKGLQTLFPVFREYAQADLLVAGTGMHETELRREAAGMKDVVFLGSLPQARLRAYYRHAIAAIVPSLCYETFGLIVPEAHREKTPVVVRALGGLQEVAEESGGGFVYRTQEELAQAMRKLQDNPALRRELGERGYQCYLARWTEEPHLEKYFGILGDAAQKKFGTLPWERPGRAGLQFPVRTTP